MVFEFDEGKSGTQTGKKHGIDFREAQRLWKGPYAEFAARREYENRFAIIGLFNRRMYTCIYTLREDRVRIISCRRSRKKERRLYEETVKKA